MPYVDMDYYAETYRGESVDEADFSPLCDRAEEIIEEMTMYHVTPVIFPTLPKNVQERVKMAVCAQIEYLDANGGSDMDNGADLQSAGIGKFNYSKASGVGGESVQSIYAPRARRILAPIGLLYRGGGCI